MIDTRQQDAVGGATVDQVLKNPRLQALVRYWNEKRGDRKMPSRQQIDPIEIPRLLPIILVADATPAGARIRLLGTDATSAYGQETRGRLASELNFDEFTPFWLDAFAFVLRSGIPASAGGPFRNGLQLHSVETVLMPLSDDGLSVTHVFGGLLIRPVPYDAPAEQKMPAPYMLSVCSG